MRTVPQAFAAHDGVLPACGVPAAPMLDEAEDTWSRLPEPERRTTAVVPVWWRPWTVLGRDTFAGDVPARLGVDNRYASPAERCPRVPADELRAARPGAVVLPDEPYRFTAGDGPETCGGLPCALVSGRHLTWCGPSLSQAPRVLGGALRAVLR